MNVEVVSSIVDESKGVYAMFHCIMNNFMCSIGYHFFVIACTSNFMDVFIRFGQPDIYKSCGE
jgi:hypothetical protein